MIQKEVQKLLHLNIKEIRGLAIKKHEVYIPFEVLTQKKN
jgi:hypothetical protein